METFESYIGFLGERLQFPQEATAYLQALARDVAAVPAIWEQFEAWQQRLTLEAWPTAPSINEIIHGWAEELGKPEEALAMLLLLGGCRPLKALYESRGIPEEIYWNGLQDLRSKLLECWEVRGIYGTFVATWFEGMFRMTRFAVGRFQFELRTLDVDYTLPDGRILPAGSPALGCHIPSHGAALTDEVRLESYRKAYQFFQNQLVQGLLVISCSSWLLYPEHQKFLPETSNILRFMGDFDLIGQTEEEGFSAGWRIFGGAWGKPYAELPEDTSLQRAYKQRLIETNRTGRGRGLLVFDGKRIVNK